MCKSKSIVKYKLLAGHWTIKPGRQNAGKAAPLAKCSCVSTKDQTLEAFVVNGRAIQTRPCMLA